MSSTPSTNHIRHMVELMTMPMHGWVMYPVVRGLLQLTMSEGGSLVGNHKNGPLVRDLALELLRLWFASLKPTGGSFAGALKPNGTDPDPTGDPVIANVIKTLTPTIAGENGTTRPDPAGAAHLDHAARTLRDCIRDAIVNPYYGFRAVANLFHTVETDTTADAYTLLNDCMSQLDPLETMIDAPDQLYALEKHAATNHNAVWRIEDLERYAIEIRASFRSSTTEHKMSNRLQIDRKFGIGHLQHLASKNHLQAQRAATPGGHGAPTASAQHAVRELLLGVCADPKLTGADIKALTKDRLLNLNVGNVSTKRARHSGDARPSRIQYDRDGVSLNRLNPRAATMSGRRHPDVPDRRASNGGPPRRAAVALVTPAMITGATAQVNISGRPGPGGRATAPNPSATHDSGPSGNARRRSPQPGRDKSRDSCGLCGELGHWRAECPHRVA